MADEPKTQTTEAGIPVGDNQNSLSAGPRGPLLTQDWQLFEKHAPFQPPAHSGAHRPCQGLGGL